MRNFLALLFSLVSFYSFGQTSDNTRKKNEANIYYQALAQYFDYIKKTARISYDSIYLEEDSRLTDSLLSQIGQTKLIKLSFAEVKEIAVKKSFTLFRIFPLEYENNEFYVPFIPFKVSKRKSKRKGYTNYLNGGGFRVFFKFEQSQFIFLRVEIYGI